MSENARKLAKVRRQNDVVNQYGWGDNRSMKLILGRRELLVATFAMPWLHTQTGNRRANVQILESVWQSARDQFYDQQMHGVDWTCVRDEFLPKAEKCSSEEELLTLLREMLGRLRSSHIFLYSQEEWSWRRNILPFCFDRVAGRVFIRFVHRGKDSTALAACEIGDEVVAVDGVSADKLRPLTLARLEAIKDNPMFGPAGSVAEIEIRRSGHRYSLKVARVARPAGFETVVVESPKPLIVHIRFFTLASDELPRVRLQQIWEQVTLARGLILDLRNCVGGDSKVSNFIAGSFLGPGKPLFRTIPRPNGKDTEVLDHTDSEAPRFGGRIALITNANTESQPELLAAICREYDCGRVVGERTAGAFNGWTLAVDLPNSFARYALPYTRSVSPKGIEYDGRGVEPNQAVANTIADFEMKQDRPLTTAIRHVEP